MHKSLKINRLYAFFFFFLSILAPVALLNGCSKEEKLDSSLRNLPLQYAKNFQLDTLSEGVLRLTVQVFLGEDSIKHHYILRENEKPIPESFKNTTIIPVPVKKMVVMSGSHYAFLKHLGAEERVIGFSDKKNIADSTLYNQIISEKVKEVGEGSFLKQELLYKLKPDVIVAFATGYSFDSNLEKIAQLGIPVLYVSEWQEASPLAKFEWIFLFDALVKMDRSVNLFEIEKEEYKRVKDSLRALNLPCHSVLLGGPVSGYWFAPGDQSYTGTLIRDAGGCSVFPKDSSLEKRLSLESAFIYAQKAKTWLHPGYYKSINELLLAENRVQLLNPYKNKRIYNFDKQKGKNGALDFYEQAVIHPSKVLKDLINILHPKPVGNNPTIWYRNIFYN